ncbi:growth/differentiation factor 9 isoform X5 [Rhinopithecus roxellana]|uniref:growth/differentiation factor 9 isoform X5 n=1 Tax=Rhinopithecus bieti TaxID=61621 RepID=UPI00083C1C84|nr:PREDICTED: growth/differentiation factor 9 isoform X5 [Rhinopithecus bieti]XP_030783356.1 growth/differentiation factor 9 isoform X5 [Rhinopithecus roxellana]
MLRPPPRWFAWDGGVSRCPSSFLSPREKQGSPPGLSSKARTELQPIDERDRAGLLPRLFKVLSVGRGGAPRLQPDSRALHYMKKLYKTYATKEGIPKSNRSHLYNTVRLFTPCTQHKQVPGDQVTGILPSVDLLFNLDRITTVEHLFKSVLLYTINNSVSFSSAVKCVCNLMIKEPKSPSKTLRRAPYSLTFNSQFEFGKKHKWIEIDVTSLLQPLVASNKRSIHMSINFTCMKDQLEHPSAQNGLFNMTLLVPPSLILYLNDTSAQAYHRWYSLYYKRRPSQGPDQERSLSAYPVGEDAAEDGRSSHHRHRRGQETVSSELKKPLVPASFNLSEYFKQFLFPQNECELHDFRLSFSQLKWDNWIVAPHRYNPRYCKGDCPRAVGHRYGSPVHTMVQNIIYEKLDSSVPRPSCVPAKYSPLSVLTIEPDGSIAYKEYEDMIATKCTCR